MKKNPLSNARLAALDQLQQVLDHGANLGETEAAGSLDPRDRAYAQHLAYGTLRWLSALDWFAGELMNRPLKKRTAIFTGWFCWACSSCGKTARPDTRR